MTPEHRAEYAETMRQLLEDANSPPFNDLARDAVRIASMILADADQQAVEIARITKLNADLSAGDIKEVCELREEAERKDAEIARLQVTIAEARRQVGEIVHVEQPHRGHFKLDTNDRYGLGTYLQPFGSRPSSAGEALVKLAATLAALGETT